MRRRPEKLRVFCGGLKFSFGGMRLELVAEDVSIGGKGPP
jgi:hypothetical protein